MNLQRLQPNYGHPWRLAVSSFTLSIRDGERHQRHRTCARRAARRPGRGASIRQFHHQRPGDSGTFTNKRHSAAVGPESLSLVNTAAGLTNLLTKGNTFGLNRTRADGTTRRSVESLGAGCAASAPSLGRTAAGEANFVGAPGDHCRGFTGQAGTVMDVGRTAEHMFSIGPRSSRGGGVGAFGDRRARPIRRCSTSRATASGATCIPIGMFVSRATAQRHGEQRVQSSSTSIGSHSRSTANADGSYVSAPLPARLALPADSGNVISWSTATAGIAPADTTMGASPMNFDHLPQYAVQRMTKSLVGCLSITRGTARDTPRDTIVVALGTHKEEYSSRQRAR